MFGRLAKCIDVVNPIRSETEKNVQLYLVVLDTIPKFSIIEDSGYFILAN